MSPITDPECRGCGTSLAATDVFCDLGAQPLANALLSADQLNQPEIHYPLRPLVCRNCLLVQLPDVPKPEGIFTDSYPFFSGQSATWLGHCKRFADQAIKRFGLGPTSRVLDIGSNDGSMLRPFRGKGIPCLGVEPSAGVAQHALMEGLPTMIDWWGTETADRLAHTEGNPTGRSWKADLVICTNVLAHVPDLKDFLDGVRAILAPGGVAMFEVPYVGNLIREVQFDQIYAEHHCYFSLKSLDVALERSGLYAFDVEHESIHGGSLRVYARDHHNWSAGASVPWMRELLEEGDTRRLHDLATYADFAVEPPKAKRRALNQLGRYYSGKRVVGYGASAKAAVTLNYFGLGPETIEFVADTTPVKWGKYLPGSHIPIKPPNALEQAKPDVVVLLAWNWAAEAVPKIQAACPDAEIVVLGSECPNLAQDIFRSPITIADLAASDRRQ